MKEIILKSIYWKKLICIKYKCFLDSIVVIMVGYHVVRWFKPYKKFLMENDKIEISYYLITAVKQQFI